MSGIGQDAKEAPKGAIWSEESLLRDLINQISERLEKLECRLQPVLRSASPPSPETDKAEEAVPDLVQRLRDRIRTAQSIDGSLVSLLERLEI